MYRKDEKVYCFHHELLYEAKVLELRPVDDDKKNGFEYRVHYKGWKNTYVSPIGSHACPFARPREPRFPYPRCGPWPTLQHCC